MPQESTAVPKGLEDAAAVDPDEGPEGRVMGKQRGCGKPSGGHEDRRQFRSDVGGLGATAVGFGESFQVHRASVAEDFGFGWPELSCEPPAAKRRGVTLRGGVRTVR